MKRWIWGLLALSAVGLALVAALFHSGSSGTPRSSAHVNTGTAHLDIDMVKDGSDWCNPVNNAATHTVSANPLDVYEVAICLTDAEAPPASFNIEFLYNDLLNSCTNVTNVGTGLDDNPDANAGTTVWDSVAHSLGTVGWDCSAGGTNYPVCDTNVCNTSVDPECDDVVYTGPGKGRAFFTCGAPSADLADLTLPVGAGVSSPIGVVSLHAAAAGVDNLAFGIVKVADYDVSTITDCTPVGTCVGATDTKQEVQADTPTPTNTPPPTPTLTPTPIPNADMLVDLADNPDPVVVGENVVYTAIVTNNGPNDASGVELVFTLPDEKVYVTASAECDDSSTCIYDTGTVTCALVDMDDGDETVCTIMATAQTEGTHTTTASVHSDAPVDLDLTNNEDSEETREVLPHAYIDKDITNGDGPCDPDFVDDETTEVVGDTHQLAVCVEYLPEYVHEFDLTLSYDDSLDTCDDNEIECPVGTACLDDNPDANDGDLSEWGGVGLGDDWDCTLDLAVGEPTCDLNDGDPGAGKGEAWISCHTNEGSSTTLRAGALAVLTLYVADHGEDDVEIESLQIWGDEAIIAQCGIFVAAQGILGGALPMNCEGARDTKVEPTATPTITPTPPPETRKRATKTPTPEPTETATPVPPTVPPPPPPPPPTATPFGGVGPEIVAPATGSGSPVGGFTWAIWLAAGIAGAAAAGGFYFRYAKKAR